MHAGADVAVVVLPRFEAPRACRQVMRNHHDRPGRPGAGRRGQIGWTAGSVEIHRTARICAPNSPSPIR